MRAVERPPGMSDDAWTSFELTHRCVEDSNANVIASSRGLRRWMTANAIGLAVISASAAGFAWKAAQWAVEATDNEHVQTQILQTLANHDEKLNALTAMQAAQGAKIDDIDQALRGKNVP
jgi:hypothetical protein